MTLLYRCDECLKEIDPEKDGHWIVIWLSPTGATEHSTDQFCSRDCLLKNLIRSHAANVDAIRPTR